MKQNLFSFSLSFLNTCNFPIFRNLLNGKQFKLYLSLTSYNVQISFCLFTGEWFPGAGWPQRSVSVAGFFQSLFNSFKGDFPRVSPADFCPKLKIFFKISLTENGILAPRICGSIIRLFLIPLSRHVTQLEWPGFLSLFTECGLLTSFHIPF